MSEPQQRVLSGGCHCRAVRYSLSIDDSIPLVATYCHCDDCRLTTGFYCALFADVQREWLRFEGESAKSITTYKSSARASRTFCSVCSTTLSYDSLDYGMELSVPTLDVPSTWDRGIRAVVRIKAHCFLRDPTAGGISNIIDDGLPRYMRGSNGEKWQPGAAHSEQKGADEAQGEALPAHCHCGGVSFVVRRPPSDYADDPVLKKWVKTRVFHNRNIRKALTYACRGRRFAAVHCLCTDCRLASGAPFFTWACVPRQLLDFVNDDTTRVYTSNMEKRTSRRFCGRCGCHVAYHIEGRDIWDVSAAVLEQPRAETWLAFTPNTPRGTDPADESIEEYTECWFANKRPLRFGEDGAKYDPDLVEEVKRGQESSIRF